MTTAVNVLEGLKSDLKTLSIVDGSNGRCMTVRGYSFAILRNGPAWDILGPKGTETVDSDLIAETIREMVMDELEEHYANTWDDVPEGIEI